METNEMVKTAIENEFNEAKTVVDEVIKRNDKYVIYKMYTVGKVLYQFLEEEMKNNNELAKNTQQYLLLLSQEYTNKKEVEEGKSDENR